MLSYSNLEAGFSCPGSAWVCRVGVALPHLRSQAEPGNEVVNLTKY